MKKFEEALKTFFEIENYKYKNEDITIAQVINFNNARLIVSEKDLASNFMLGFVYLKKIENFPLSLEHLEKILTNCLKSEENRPLLKKVSEYLKEIKSKMNIS